MEIYNTVISLKKERGAERQRPKIKLRKQDYFVSLWQKQQNLFQLNEAKAFPKGEQTYTKLVNMNIVCVCVCETDP